MWSKLSNALGRHRHESDASASSSQSQRSEVLDKVYEQHPNLSVFHTHEEEPQEEGPEVPFPNNPSPPSSPSRHGRVGLFKRHSRVRDDDSIRAPSPLLGFPKKVRSTLNLRHNSAFFFQCDLHGANESQILNNHFLVCLVMQRVHHRILFLEPQ